MSHDSTSSPSLFAALTKISLWESRVAVAERLFSSFFHGSWHPRTHIRDLTMRFFSAVFFHLRTQMPSMIAQFAGKSLRREGLKACSATNWPISL